MQLTEQQRRMFRNDFANRCFRERADKDYIAARVSYRAGLPEPFLWSALQAIEKYLKAILLYNDRSTKKLSHDVSEAYKWVRQISHIPFDIPDWVEGFIAYLNRNGPWRYLEASFYTKGRELIELDWTVWHLRRYCKDLRAAPSDMNEDEILRINIADLAYDRWKEHPHKFRIFGGYLETVLDRSHQNDDAVRRALIWKNAVYGTRRRRTLRNYVMRGASANAPHFLHRESYYAVKDLVHFPKEIVRAVEEGDEG
jgi:HEPN domain-containing protein